MADRHLLCARHYDYGPSALSGWMATPLLAFVLVLVQGGAIVRSEPPRSPRTGRTTTVVADDVRSRWRPCRAATARTVRERLSAQRRTAGRQSPGPRRLCQLCYSWNPPLPADPGLGSSTRPRRS